MDEQQLAERLDLGSSHPQASALTCALVVRLQQANGEQAHHPLIILALRAPNPAAAQVCWLAAALHPSPATGNLLTLALHNREQVAQLLLGLCPHHP